MPAELNWWIGVVFALGSLCFLIGSLLSLSPPVSMRFGLATADLNAIFFIGSIPFTTAAYLQLLQAANSGSIESLRQRPRERLPAGRLRAEPARFHWFGWKPADIGWLSCALQFPGTLLFNINTFNGMRAGLGWTQQEVLIWIPDVLGSVLFLLSGALAFMEAGHAYWSWKPGHLSWWVTLINLIGCIGFMLAAINGTILPSTHAQADASLSLVYTAVGAMGFLIGSLLMLPESLIPS
ncbi:hypothetical protein [Synechococcus sp. RSCCF101]|uniref:hypothetical protein n=1 Tax=Synechococcus sp. RSCCF101 TaxID=2511069 RepID=UPI001CD93FF2|nr:hypothetical protein [Synechococcus sp. RSCCF101]